MVQCTWGTNQVAMSTPNSKEDGNIKSQNWNFQGYGVGVQDKNPCGRDIDNF